MKLSTIPANFRRLTIFSVLALTLGGCLKNVGQHSQSGTDAKKKGAKEIVIEENEGQSRDIVTYPGGDRVDWKFFTIPDGQTGKLKIKVKWKPARSGMDVAFNVYDEFAHRVAEAKPSKRPPRSKTVKLSGASGKYYVQIYAPRRSDAAEYIVNIEFAEGGPKTVGAEKLIARIADPPDLPAIPEADGTAGAIDPKTGLPVGTGEAPQGPVLAKVVRSQQSRDGGVSITLNRGTRDGVKEGWSGTLLRGKSQSSLQGGRFKIIRAGAAESYANVSLTVDQVRQNNRAKISPP